jgi:hypothetical protein
MPKADHRIHDLVKRTCRKQTINTVLKISMITIGKKDQHKLRKKNLLFYFRLHGQESPVKK